MINVVRSGKYLDLEDILNRDRCLQPQNLFITYLMKIWIFISWE
jgi:hypothetical protein